MDDYEAWVEGGEKRKFAGAEPPPAPPRPPGAPQPKPKDRSKSDRVIVLEGEGETHNDTLYASRTIEYLKRAKETGRPFFIACGFGNPHCPPQAPKKFFDLYDAKKISLPVDFAPNIRPPAGAPLALTMNGDLFLNRDASEAEAREMIRGYWAAVSFVDAQVGRIMAALEENGLAQNTIVVLWGDHEGASLRPLLREPATPWDRPAYSFARDYTRAKRPDEVTGCTVRTERWRYAEWYEGKQGAFLYDHTNDPQELKNLATDPAYAAPVKELRAKLARFPK